MASPTRPNRQFSIGSFLTGFNSSKEKKESVMGKQVWVPDDKECYLLGVITAQNEDGTLIATASDGREVSGKRFQARDVLDEREADLVQMAHVDTPNILHTLRKRHAEGAVYTAVGQLGIIISVNPYRWIDIYTADIMREHYESFGTKELAPHVYALAADAYKALCVHGASQTIVTSGESGAGKTENSKQVFRFLAEIAGVQTSDGAGGVSMQDLLIHSNPVLEAFGNAKTLRNDNSSRFGKLVTVHFDGSGRIMGAYTRNYLLERPRVSSVPVGERNYHAFYFLLRGAHESQRSSRHVSDVAAEHALLKGGVVTVPGVDDVKEWREVCSAMGELGFAETEQSALFDALAGLLHLGNASFVADSSVAHGDNAAKLASAEPVEHAAELLGVDRRAFVGALTGLKVRDMLKALSVEQAAKNRDAFVAAVYAELFDWIVQRINAVGVGSHDEAGMAAHRFIGVLDIFGFEIFQTNSFEQLCINFANERLQHNFTSTTFAQEEGLYEQEGIPFEHIPYADNLAVLQMIDCADPKKRGIMQLLDEETRLPRTTDKTLLDKMNSQFSKGGTAPSPAYATDFRAPELFTVKHYAGDVKYAVKDFLEKSVENVSADLVGALGNSTKPLFAALFHQQSSRRSRAGFEGGNKSEKSSKKPTVGIKFATQLTSLITTIEQTNAHFIRCVKPNADKSATLFDTPLCLEQLRYSGVFEAVAIRKAGYPFRLTLQQFANRYRCLLPVDERGGVKYDGSKGAVEYLLKALGKLAEKNYPLSEVRIGHTRVFYRSQTNRALEVEREKFVQEWILKLQRASRGGMARAVRRALSAAKSELAAAVSAMELSRLDAALAAVQTPQRVFYAHQPIPVVLHVPELASVMELHADLTEEVRVEESLAKKTNAADLQAVYADLLKEHAIGSQLKSKLGRAVPSLDAAECVIGLTEGVAEHDHERLTKCLASAEQMGLAPRLGPAMAIAKEEVSNLAGGLVLEAAITTELAKGRSKYGGSGTWDHSALATGGLQKALDAGVALPLISKSGKRLMAHARVALKLRQAIKSDDWAGLKKCLEGLDILEQGAEEVESAWSELRDTAGIYEAALEAELNKGRSRRVADGRPWDHTPISTAGVLEKQKALLAFPLISDKAKRLLSQAELSVSLRKALLTCDWAKAASWGCLAGLLEGVAVDLRESEEVQLTWQEFKEMRSATEGAMRKALESGRSVRCPAGNGWSHDGIAIEPLKTALGELEAFPRVSEAGTQLAARGLRAIMLREALLQASLSSPSSWAPLAEVLEAASDQSASAYDAAGGDEASLARDELHDARSHFAALLRTEMAKGQSKRKGMGEAWDRSELSHLKLAEALDACATFPRPDNVMTELCDEATALVAMRTALAASAWGQPATWRAFSEYLESVDYTEVAELKSAQQELDECQKALEKAITTSLKAGCSRKAGNSWSHEGITTTDVAAALAAVRAFPRLSPTGKSLISRGELVISLREAILKADWAEASSWGPLCDLLDKIPSDLKDDDEVRAAHREAADKRGATEEAMRSALAAHRSVRAPAGATAANGILNGGGRGGSAASSPAAANGGGGGVANGEVVGGSPSAAAASTPPRKRLSLSKFSSFTGSVPGSAPGSAKSGGGGGATPGSSGGPPSKRLSRAGTGGSIAGAPSASSPVSVWSHDDLSTDGVVTALQQMRGFPRKSAEGEALGATADVTLELRALLLKAPWGVGLKDSTAAFFGWQALAEWLGKAGGGPFREEEEIVAAQSELSDRRGLVCNSVREALRTGRSLRPLQSGSEWSHEELALEPLGETTGELEALVRMLGGDVKAAPDETALLLQAHTVRSVREALLICDWAKAATWGGLFSLLDKLTSPELRAIDEVQCALKEFDAKQAATEAALTAALGSGRSVRVSADKWLHDKITVEPLKTALGELEAFPRVSEAGRKLAGRAELVRSLRQTLHTCDWGVASTWAGLATLLAGVAHEFDEEAEVCLAKDEIREKREAIEKATQLALDTGRAVRVAEGEWEHEGLAVDTLKIWLSELSAFPITSDAGTRLLACGSLAVKLREALRLANFEESSSWTALDTVLEATPPSEDERNGVADFGELNDARAEFEDMREATEQAVEEGLASHRAVRVGAPPPEGASCAALMASWDHSAIETDLLQQAIELAEGFPRMSPNGTSLVSRARVALGLREALLECEWTSAASWMGLVGAIDQATHVLSADDAAALDELAAAKAELADAKRYVEQAVHEAMATGRALRKGEGSWDHSGILLEPLQRAIAELGHFPVSSGGGAGGRRMSIASDPSRGLAAQGKHVLELRTSLITCDWAKAASWAGLVQVLDGLPPELPDLDEVSVARQELLEKQALVTETLQEAMKSGGSVRGKDGAPWDHSKIETATLKEAADECEAFPKPHVEGPGLVARARTLVKLRSLLSDVLPAKPPSWKPVLAFLQALMLPEDLTLPEVQATWQEFKEAKEAANKAITKSLTDGCSRPAGGGGLRRWDHSKMDAEGLVRAALHLESFPALDAAGVAPAAAASPMRAGPGGGGGGGPAPRLSTRTSLVLKTAASDSLVAAAKGVARLREMIISDDWSEVHAFVGKAEKTLSDLPAPAADEYRRASQELQNMAALLEQELKTALNSNRAMPRGAGSGAPGGGGAAAASPAPPASPAAPPATPPSGKFGSGVSAGSASVKSKPSRDLPGQRGTGKWDHSELEVETLDQAEAELRAFPLHGASALALLRQAELIRPLRLTLLKCDWQGLTSLLDSIKDAELQQLDEVRSATQELEDARQAVEAEVAAALASGRSLKVIGAKKTNFTNKTFWVPVEWDHSGLEAGVRRLQRAVDAANAFPTPLDSAKELFATADIALKLRRLIHAHDMPGLGAALQGFTSLAEQRLDEVNTAWHEYLCHELERATKALDQSALKVALAKATAVGMQPFEKPVDRALDVFIDPPEFVVDLREGDVFPAADGSLVLRVKVRGANTIHWVKNDIRLREGADGGRIKGVETPQLTLTHILARDANQQVWCIAENRWGKLMSTKVSIRTEVRKTPLARQNVSATKLIGGVGDGPGDGKPANGGSGGGSPDSKAHKSMFGGTLSALSSKFGSSKSKSGKFGSSAKLGASTKLADSASIREDEVEVEVEEAAAADGESAGAAVFMSGEI